MVYLIAEIGFNHGGEIDLAVAMVEAAAKTGVDAVKFQSFRADDLYFPTAPEYAIFKAGELSEKEHVRLKEVCDDTGLDFISTPFSLRWVDFLDELNVKKIKIASMDLNNRILIEAAAKKERPLIISTGGGTMDEMKQAATWATAAGCKELTMLHCISNYPTLPHDASLPMMSEMQNELAQKIGFSDHTLGIDAAVEATALGATIIEKHFTLDKNLPGPDNALSADGAEMKVLVEAVRQTPQRASTGTLHASSKQRPDEAKRSLMRRGIYAGRDIQLGENLSMENIVLVRPEKTPLERLSDFLGKKASHAYVRGDAIDRLATY